MHRFQAMIMTRLLILVASCFAINACANVGAGPTSQMQTNTTDRPSSLQPGAQTSLMSRHRPFAVTSQTLRAVFGSDTTAADRDDIVRMVARATPRLAAAIARSSYDKLYIVDVDMGSGRVYSNHAVAKSLFAKRRRVAGKNLYFDEMGRLFAGPPADPKPLSGSNLHGVFPKIVVNPNPGTGPYRRVYSTNASGIWGDYALVSLPCNAQHVFGQDRGYIYQGGWSNGGSAVDSGLVYSINNYYSPFISVDGTEYTGGSLSVLFDTGPNPYSNLTWPCGTNVYIYFDVADNHGIISFSNITSTTDWTCGTDCNGNLNGIIAWETFPNGLRDWNDVCAGCVVKRVTSIGQSPESLSNGEWFGPVFWTNAEVGLYPGIYLTPFDQSLGGCENYPAWTSSPGPTDGCTSSPSNSSIGVGYANADSETDFITANGNNVQGQSGFTKNATNQSTYQSVVEKCPTGNDPGHGPQWYLNSYITADTQMIAQTPSNTQAPTSAATALGINVSTESYGKAAIQLYRPNGTLAATSTVSPLTNGGISYYAAGAPSGPYKVVVNGIHLASGSSCGVETSKTQTVDAGWTGATFWH